MSFDPEHASVSDAVDVIVVSYNQRDRLLTCLESVCARGAPHHVIVVDNASSDGSAAAVRESFPSVELIEMGTNAGFACAVNRGLESGGSPLVLLLNNDARLDPGALDDMCSALADSEMAAAGPRLLGERGETELSLGRTLSPWNEAFFRALELLYRSGRGPVAGAVNRYYGASRSTRSLSAACLLLRRAALEQVGGLDERFFLYAEDVDLCLRLRQAGWKLVFVASAIVRHDRGASSSTDPPATALHYRRSQMAFYRKHRGPVAAFGLRFYLAVRFATKRLIARGEQRELAATLLSWTLHESGR